jgi:hypothetical protein
MHFKKLKVVGERVGKDRKVRSGKEMVEDGKR